MAGTQDQVELNAEILKDFLMPLSFEAIVTLLRKWGYDVNSQNKSKVKLFQETVGNTLSGEKFHDLWLLREMNTVVKNRNWKILRFSSKKIQSISIVDLKAQLEAAIESNIVQKGKFKITIDEIDKNEYYIVADFQGKPKIIEELGEGLKVIHPVRRIRMILDTATGVARLNGGSPQGFSKYIKVLEKVLDSELTSQPIYSYVLRDFVQKVRPIRRISLVCPREMGGFSGVERITVEGPDVVAGMDDLRSRQEILFNFDGLSKLGAWTTVHSRLAKIDVKGNVQISDPKMKERLLKFIG